MCPLWPLSSILSSGNEGSLVGAAGGQAVMTGGKAVLKTQIILYAAPPVTLSFMPVVLKGHHHLIVSVSTAIPFFPLSFL